MDVMANSAPASSSPATRDTAVLTRKTSVATVMNAAVASTRRAPWAGGIPNRRGTASTVGYAGGKCASASVLSALAHFAMGMRYSPCSATDSAAPM